METEDPTTLAYELTAKHFGLTVDQVRRFHIRQARREGAHSVPERQIRKGSIRDTPREGYAVSHITTTLDAEGGIRSQTLRSRVYDPQEEPEVPEGMRPRRMSVLRNGAGEVINYWEIFSAQDLQAAEKLEVLRGVVADLVSDYPRAERRETAPVVESKDLLALYPLGDPHIGMRAADDTGLYAGARELVGAVGDLVSRGPRTEECIVVSLGDYYHSDDPSNKTRRHGNDLDVDGSWREVLKVGVSTYIALIDAAREHHARTYVYTVVGNHDDLSSVFLSMLIDHHYRDCPDVVVDASGDGFLWHVWGDNLFGFTHGHECKLAKLPAKMANARSRDWGSTRYRYWHTGHVHHDRRVEIDGVMIETHRTLARRDDYAERSGYISGRDLKRITYHRHRGEVSRETCAPGLWTPWSST